MSGKEIPVRVSPSLAGLMPRFLAQCRREAVEIRRALEEGNLVAARAIGHTLTGAGGGYGLDEISLLGAEIDRAARSGDAQAVLRFVERLDEYLERVRPVFD